MATISDLTLRCSLLSTDELHVRAVDTDYKTTLFYLADSIDSLKSYSNTLSEYATSISTLQTDKLSKDGSIAMTGLLTLVDSDPIDGNHAARKSYVDNKLSAKLDLVGGTLTGALNMGGFGISGLANPSIDDDAVNLLYLRQNTASYPASFTPAGSYPTYFPPGTSGVIRKGDLFRADSDGTITSSDAVPVTTTLREGDLLIALVDSPGQLSDNWGVISTGIVDATTTAAGIVRLATNAEANAKTATDVALTPSNLAGDVLKATETFEGFIRIATQSEVDTGTDDTTAITPQKLKDSIEKVKSDYEVYISPLSAQIVGGTGSSSIVREAQGDYAHVKATADTNVIYAFDITEAIRKTTNLGFRLDSVSVVYTIGTANLDRHAITIDRVTYANGSASPQITNILATDLQTAVSTTLYVTNVVVSGAAFQNAATTKYAIEIDADGGSTSVYKLRGLFLHFTRAGS